MSLHAVPVAHLLGLFFAALAVVFLLLALRRRPKRNERSHPAAKAFLRIGLIFAAVSLYLLLLAGPQHPL